MNSSGSSFGILSSIISSVTHASCSVGEKEMVVLRFTKSEPARERVLQTVLALVQNKDANSMFKIQA